MNYSLMTIQSGNAALLSAATMDGIAGAAIWARKIENLKSFLFTSEGKTGDLFSYPAIKEASELRSLYCLGLSLVDEDIPLILPVLQRSGLSKIMWVDHHVMNPAHIALLNANSADVINDSTYHTSCRLLLDSFSESDATERAICAAIESGPDRTEEPWRSWLYVMMAIRSDLYGIRNAIRPLIENRLEAYDPALRQAGEAIWNDIDEFAGTNLHRQQVNDRFMGVLGLPLSLHNDYRLIVDRVMDARDLDYCLVFFDGLDRLVIRRNWRKIEKLELWSLSSVFEDYEFQVMLYDADTIFLVPPIVEKLHMVEKALAVISSSF